jgi:hypothetical protein
MELGFLYFSKDNLALNDKTLILGAHMNANMSMRHTLTNHSF